MLAIFFESRNAGLCLRFFIVAILILPSFVNVSLVSAQEPASEIEVFDLFQQDLNGDGVPDLTTIECAFITDHDRVLVYDRGKDMQISTDWQQATDFQNDLWVFDATADGQVELIIEFQESAGGLEARLWDDRDGDGTVSYQPPPNLEISETAGPSLTVVARDGWWQRHGKLNFNLDLTVDGYVQASFSSKSWLRFLKTDGVPDFLIQVRDTDEDGRPDFQWVDAWPDARSKLGVRRTEIAVNPHDDEPPIHGGIFWPFLGSTHDWDELHQDRPSRLSDDRLNILQEWTGYTKFYNTSMPPIQMLWQKGVLLYVGEFVASRFNDNNWFTYSIRRAQPDQISPVNFEAPFAFYDLAEDDDGYPELAIRFEQYLERDLFPFREKNVEPVQVIRYTWDQNNNTGWDYKLGLIGRHPVTETVAVGDLTLQMIPPSILPEWVIDRTWDGATLVVSDGREFWTSEGIYEWGPVGHWRDRYVTGFSQARPSLADLSELMVGQRGEYSFDLHRLPMLYLSLIDRKIHLLGAEGGVWKIDETRDLHYANLGGDYLNQWTLYEDGSATKEIYFASHYLLYEDQAGMQLTRVDNRPEIFITSPPTNNLERLALEGQLKIHGQDFPPGDFKALVDQFGPPQTKIAGASIREFRLTGDGFRFILELGTDIRAHGEARLNLDALAAGDYLVSYDGAFEVKPLRPSNLALSIRIPHQVDFSPGVPIPMLMEAKNSGVADARDHWLIVEARQADSSILISRQRTDILSGLATRLLLDWKPPAAGRWEIHARLATPEGRMAAQSLPLLISIDDGSASPGQIFVSSIGGYTQVIPLGITALVFLFITGNIIWRVTRPTSWARHNW